MRNGSRESTERSCLPGIPPGAPRLACPHPAPPSKPYFDQLNATLSGLATASPHSTQIVQTLGAGVHDVLAQLARVVGDNLLPAVQGLGRRLKKAEGKGDRGLTQQLDRTLNSLDMMKDLVASLRKIDMSELTVKAVEKGNGG